jgi:hypothetical protein
MKPALFGINIPGCYHFVNGSRVDGCHDKLRGDVTGLRGDVTGLRGYVSGLRGDVDECEISDDERAKGVAVADLILEPEKQAAE